MKLAKRSKSNLDPKLEKLRKEVLEYGGLLEVAREATNDANRQKTVVKNALLDVLKSGEHNVNSGVVVNGVVYRYVPNETEIIDPRTWHRLYMDKKISENQYFAALSVAMGEAKKAVGEDQIPDISTRTMTKSADLRIAVLEPDQMQHTGTIIPPVGHELPTQQQIKARKVAPPPDKKIVKTVRTVKVSR